MRKKRKEWGEGARVTLFDEEECEMGNDNTVYEELTCFLSYSGIRRWMMVSMLLWRDVFEHVYFPMSRCGLYVMDPVR